MCVLVTVWEYLLSNERNEPTILYIFLVRETKKIRSRTVTEFYSTLALIMSGPQGGD